MRYLNELEYSQPQSTYAGEAVQEVKGLNEAMSNEYNETRQNKDLLDLAASNLDVRDVDYATKKQAIDDIKNQFKDLVANGNYQDANFKVRDAFKKFTTDKTLQGIVKSKQLEDAYKKDMQDKLAKNIIGKEAYDYGMTKTNEANQTPYSFDEQTGDEKGLFSGYKIHDDKTKEIFELMDKRIKDWKETGVMYVNGDKFEVRNIKGVEYYLKNGVGVDYDDVQNALKTEVENTTDFKDFMSQDREIKMYQRFGDKPITKKDLKEFNDDNIKTLITGVTPNDIKKAEQQLATMEKSVKSASDKEAILKLKGSIQDMKEGYNNVNTEDPETLRLAYDRYLRKDQLNKFTSPAAEKASYEKDEYKLFKDDAALANIKAKNDKAHEKYKKELYEVNPYLTTNFSKEIIDSKNYKELTQNITNLENDAAAKKSLLDATPKGTTLYNQRLNDYNIALSAANTAKVGTEEVYSKLTPETTQKLGERISTMFSSKGAEISNWDYRISSKALDDLIKIAENNKDTKTVTKLKTAKLYFNEGKTLTDSFADEMGKLLVKKEYLPVLNSADNERVERSAIIPDQKSGFTSEGQYNAVGEALGMVGGLMYHQKGLHSAISDIMNTELEKNQVTRVRKDVYNLTDAGQKLNNKESNLYFNTTRAALKNNTDLITPEGKSLANIEGENKFFIIGKDKDNNIVKTPANFDPDKTIVSPAPGGKGNYIAVTYFDKEGNKLSYGDESASSKETFFVKSGNPELNNTIYKLAANVAKTTGQMDKVIKLEGEANFGETFRPMDVAIGTTTEPFLVNFPDGTQEWVKLKQVPGSEEASYLIKVSKDKEGKFYDGESMIKIKEKDAKGGIKETPKQYRNIDEMIEDLQYREFIKTQK